MQEKANLESNRAFINSKSDKVLYDRFCKDYAKVCDHMDLDISEDATTSITCSLMSSLFLQMGFATPNGNDQEQLLLA
jgi:hypothetical protein